MCSVEDNILPQWIRHLWLTDSCGVRELCVAPRFIFSACLGPSSWQSSSRNPGQGSCAKTLHLVRALRGCYTLDVAARWTCTCKVSHMKS